MWDSVQFELQAFCEDFEARGGAYMGALNVVLFIGCACVIGDGRRSLFSVSHSEK